MTRVGTQIISMMRARAQINRVRRDWQSSVMRGFLFSQRVTRDFPLKFPYKKDRGAPRKISRTRLKGTRILFYGRVPNVTIDNRFVESRSHHIIALLVHSSTARSM